jgi:hypothetical protein
LGLMDGGDHPMNGDKMNSEKVAAIDIMNDGSYKHISN